MALAVIASLAMTAVAFFIGSPFQISGNTGICIPSPNEWGLTPAASWLLNLIILFGSGVLLTIANKQYTFVKGADTVLSGIFLLMATSNVWVSSSFSSASLMVFINVLCLIILLGCYRQTNATRDIFMIGTLLSIGSMMQYAFIFMIPVYLIGSILMKCVNFKTIIAYLMGLVAPYWIGIGMGILEIESFKMPIFTSVIDGYIADHRMFICILNVSLTALIGFILALNNMVKLYAGNTQKRLNNVVINMLGLAVAICMIFDYSNITTYLGLLYMITAVQIANLFALWQIRRGRIWLITIIMLYVIGFIIMAIGI